MTAWSTWCWQRTTWWIGMGESGRTRMWHRRTTWIIVNNVRGSCNWSSKSVVRTPVSKQPVVSTIQPIHDAYHREWVTLKYIINRRNFLTSTQVSSRNSSIQKRRWLTRWIALANGNDLVKRLGIKTFDVDIERTAAGRTQLFDDAIRNGMSRGYLLSRHSAPTYRAPNSDKSQRILQSDGRTFLFQQRVYRIRDCSHYSTHAYYMNEIMQDSQLTAISLPRATQAHMPSTWLGTYNSDI